MREQSFTGLWWLPSTPDTKLSGTLELSAGGRAVLRLVGLLSPFEAYNHNTEYPIVLGFSDSGKMITLVDTATSGFAIHAPGMPTEELVATLVLLGAHFEDPSDVIVSTTYAEFTYLSEWIGPRTLSDEHDANHVRLTWTRPTFPSATVGDRSIGISPGFKVTGDGVRQRGINPSFAVRFDGEGSLESTVHQWIRPFQNLLTLGVGDPSVVTAVRFKSSRGETPRPGDSIEAIFRVDAPTLVRRTPRVHDMLFALQHVESEFEHLVQGWYRAHAELEDVCNLYFTTLARGGPFEVQFLNLVRAVEVFDRIRHGNRVMPKAQHRAMVREIVSAAPELHADWLREMLTYSNEPTLRARLQRLMGPPISDVMEPICGDLDTWVRLVSDTRNYYTHYEAEGEPKAAKGINLLRTTQRLQVMVGALLLQASNLDGAVLTALFENNQHFIWLRRVHMGLEG